MASAGETSDKGLTQTSGLLLLHGTDPSLACNAQQIASQIDPLIFSKGMKIKGMIIKTIKTSVQSKDCRLKMGAGVLGWGGRASGRAS
eukprot:SAG11_NODE_31660_length_290_cov_0.743455_1_plen_87_part_10